ncbi:MAG: hypothetical protein AAFP92_14760, partial [Bacteroidota bacterium]
MLKPFRSPASGPRHQFKPQPTQQAFRLPRVIFTLATAFAFIFFGPQLSNIARGPQHLFAGQVKAPNFPFGQGESFPFSSLSIEVYADVNQNGRIDEPDFLSGISPVQEDGRFELEILHGQSFLMLGEPLGPSRADEQSFRFLPPSLPEGAFIQDMSIQLAFDPETQGLLHSSLSRAGEPPVNLLFETHPNLPAQSVENKSLQDWWDRYKTNPGEFELDLRLAKTKQAFPGPVPAPKLIIHYNLPPKPYLVRIQPTSLPTPYFHDPIQLSFGNHPHILLHCKPYQATNQVFSPGAFEAAWIKDEVVLSWEADTLPEATHFEIMFSADGMDFERIGSLPAQQGFPAKGEFEFRDYLPLIKD